MSCFKGEGVLLTCDMDRAPLRGSWRILESWAACVYHKLLETWAAAANGPVVWRVTSTNLRKSGR